MRPGRGDARTLMTLWFLRKSTYWIFWLGLIAAALARREANIEVTGSASPRKLWDELHSPLAGVALAVLVRLFTAGAGLLVTYPLARDYETGLEPRTNFGKSIGIVLDRYKVMRAFRALRWTHHVRQVALRNLGAAGPRVARLDPIMDVANITLPFVAVAVIAATAGSA